jgi:hypothetical protein
LLRIVRGGPWVGAAIWHTEDGWFVMLDGDQEGPCGDPWMLPNMEKVHWGGRATTQAEVAYRVGLKRYAALYDLSHPAANARQAIDLDRYLPI